MKKIKFNESLFNIFPSPDNPDVSFVFNKDDGSIFQVEGITKEFLLKLISVKSDEQKIIEDFSKIYKMKSEDVKNFIKVIGIMKKTKVII